MLILKPEATEQSKMYSHAGDIMVQLYSGTNLNSLSRIDL